MFYFDFTESMGTLLLASNGSFITENEAKIFKKPISQMNLAYISTASRGAKDLSYFRYRREQMKKLQFNYEEIDIEGKSKDELYEILAKKEAVFMEGGNSFYLLRAIQNSGLGEIIKDLLNQGLIYIGSSAGAYVTCPSIEMAAWINRHGFDSSIISDYTAMNLVPFLIFAHYDAYTLEQQEVVQKKAAEAKYPVKILRDYQALLVENGKITFIDKSSAQNN